MDEKKIEHCEIVDLHIGAPNRLIENVGEIPQTFGDSKSDLSSSSFIPIDEDPHIEYV